MGQVGLEWSGGGLWRSFRKSRRRDRHADARQRHRPVRDFRHQQQRVHLGRASGSKSGRSGRWRASAISSTAGPTSTRHADAGRCAPAQFEIFDIRNNAARVGGADGPRSVGNGAVAGFGDFSGHANETDMLLRNGNSGAFEIDDISNNQTHLSGADGPGRPGMVVWRASARSTAPAQATC